MKKYTILPILTLWAILAALCWFSPAKETSDAERRTLAQKPEITVNSVLNGDFMTDFESYSLDQFPLRDNFRTLKSLFHYGVLGQKDNNGIYLSEGYAAQQEYPLKEASVAHALERFGHLYTNYLTESRVFMAIVPDKGYYLAENSGNLSMDYEALFAIFRENMPWATHIDLTDTLTLQDYYCTDTHWRQENLFSAASRLCENLGVTAPKPEDYTKTALDRPFYGVYYGQAALPLEPETMYVLNNELLQNCRVYDYETGKTGTIYDETKLESKDLYDIYLSGAKALLTIDNPSAKTDKELLIFRDSFASSLAPLLLQDYAKVTLIDLRYLQIDLLDQFLDFHGQDVLFLYSTLVLNNSATIK